MDNTQGEKALEFDMEAEFKEALREKKLYLDYQPIFELKNSDIFAFEALMRWKHPQMGQISPGRFIPVAEESGAIIEASHWVLEESCKALNRIKAHAGAKNNYMMSVNFSATDFAEENFTEQLYIILSKTDVAPNRIILEITEDMILSQPRNAKETLRMCRSVGMNIAVDNFGTGRTTLEYLKDFSFNILKIDRRFTRDMMSDESVMEFVKSSIARANELEITTIAEGIETNEELKTVKMLGYDAAQGFHLAKPVGEVEIMEMLSHWDENGGKNIPKEPKQR